MRVKTGDHNTTKTKKKTGPAKKGASKSNIMENASPDKYFFLGDGRPLKNLLELSDALEEMNDDIFHQHVNEDKNDFAKWASEVFHDDELAIKLGHSKPKDKQQLIILRHIIRRLV